MAPCVRASLHSMGISPQIRRWQSTPTAAHRQPVGMFRRPEGGAGLAVGLQRKDAGMRVIVLSDTHAPRFWKSCPRALTAPLRDAELVLHAGDVCVPSVLDELAQFAPVRVVRGNNDGPDVAAWGAPDTAEFDLEGLSIAMIHGSGARGGRLQRMRRRFPGARLVIFGHSHIPCDEADDGLRILNPGSPTDKRRQPTGTFAVLDVVDGHLLRADILAVE